MQTDTPTEILFEISRGFPLYGELQILLHNTLVVTRECNIRSPCASTSSRCWSAGILPRLASARYICVLLTLDFVNGYGGEHELIAGVNTVICSRCGYRDHFSKLPEECSVSRRQKDKEKRDTDEASKERGLGKSG